MRQAAPISRSVTYCSLKIGSWTVTRGSVPEVLPWTLAAAGAIDVMLLQFGFSAAADRRGAALLPVPIGSGSGLALVGRF